MRWPGRGTRTRSALPGVSGTARIGRRGSSGADAAYLRRLGPGDVAVIDQVDLDRATAAALLEAGVVGVVNAAPSISGRYPNLGPEILVEAGVTLVDDCGAGVFTDLVDGATVRLHDGAVHVGDREVLRGFGQDRETVADLLEEARGGMAAQLEAFSANTSEFLGRERALLVDGVGVPAVSTSMRDKQVVVVAGGPGTAEEVRSLTGFIREYKPVLIGVGDGADALRDAGLTPAVVIGTVAELDPALARKARDVVVPADPDGFIAGLARMQDLGVDPVAFPSSANPEDLALLLAHAHGAALVVAVGFDASLGGFLDRGRSGSIPSTFLTRLRLGPTLVDAPAVLALYRSRVSILTLVMLVVAVLAAAVVAALALGAGPSLVLLLQTGGRAVLDWGTAVVRSVVG
ncbi:putative cytokinetic ring protein SteA [Actinomycetospora sp. CA-084318]|uniref:putative cytokinetic ring protein SteA n=1 Tax=Actinomycetospora sp. CA-084318 TaxID=3239892 RepID=UPI003D955A68